MQKMEISEHIVIDPEICHGQITFKGTRVPVETFMTFLAKGYSMDVLLESWPQISRPAAKEAISLAATAFQKQYASFREQAPEGLIISGA